MSFCCFRYKSLIESRRSDSSSQSSQNASNSNALKQLSKESTGQDSSTEQKQRTIIVRNTPVCGSGPKIDVLSSAQSLPSPPSTDSSAPTLSVIDSKSLQRLLEQKSQTSPTAVSSNVLEPNSRHMSPSPVKVVITSTPSSSSIKVQNSSQVNSDSKNIRNEIKSSRPLSAPEASIEDFIVHQLTDDEKAVLQRSSRQTIEDQQMGAKNMNTNGKSSANCSGNVAVSSDNTPNKPKPGNDRPKPRIITVSKPLPKPELKAPEPKYVNGKLVFGQIPVKPCLAKGSVAERVLLFEKCPEKTSVTKVKKTDKSRDKITYNKVGQWMKLNDNNNNKVIFSTLFTFLSKVGYNI